MAKSLEELVHPTWLPVLWEQQDNLTQIGEFLRSEQADGRPWCPVGQHILRAFEQPMNAVRVLITGQDPYPTPGHAAGLSFSVAADVRPLPRSLQNIFKELASDLDLATPSSGDLTPWAEQGVLLLNRVLTVRVGEPGSHRGIGWEAFTEAAIRGLVERLEEPLVAILWGKDAQSLTGILEDVPILESAHPSPLSADRGFFGSRPFSQANEFLDDLGGEPVSWALP